MNKTCIRFVGAKQLEIVQEPVDALKEGEVLLETTRTMISTGTETTCYNRSFAPGTHWDNWVKYPFPAGYLGAGKVVDVGAGVNGFKPGDRVAWRARHESHQVRHTRDIVPIPDGVSDEEASWMGLAKIVQVGVRAAQHVMGDNVVCIGLGLLGQLTVQYARLLGCDQIIAIDTAPMRLEMAKRHGATTVINATAADAKEEVYRLTEGRGADVVYDITGHPAVLATAFPLARKFGKVVLLGDPGAPSEQRLSGELITRGLQLIGAHDGLPPREPNEWVRWSTMDMYKVFLRYVQRGQMKVSDLITHRYDPQQAAEAYEMLNRERQTAMGVVFTWK